MQRRVLAGGSVGQFIEFYDFALYGLSAVVLSSLFFPSENQLVGLLALFATFGVAFFIRPLGGLFFGALGDRIGRRNVLVITLLTIGVATTGIGLLPTYETVGPLAPILLVLLRLLQGLSAGGESAGAPSFVFEHAPIRHRGLFINITLAATALPSVVAAFFILFLSSSMSDEAFQSWGWRMPFLIALPLALVGLWIRSRTEESPAFKEMMHEQEQKIEDQEIAKHTPVRDAFRNNWLKMIQVVFIMGLTAMGFYFLSGYFVSYVQTSGNLSREQSLLLNGFAMLMYTILLPIAGMIGDRVGRRPMMIGGALAIAVLAVPSFMLVTSGSVALALCGQLLFVVAICSYGGGCYTFFIEVFDTKSRFTSAAFSYNLGYAILGGTAPFVGTALVNATAVPFSPAFYVIAIALLTLLAMAITRVPETRGWTN
ncbi:MHS family MFS transporter [Kocuria coralli]|uniref:Putative proline/betaine transporter n=2 Tax=Kocuria coralli TaxID=1461025 RepID=A0A5J5KWT8_9MICC|nr:MHS family MFS transporter [Kocuria coralli]